MPALHFMCVCVCMCVLQEQYIFIHDAILEAITCGDTQISACDLRTNIQKLSNSDPETNVTGFESQFKVYTFVLLHLQQSTQTYNLHCYNTVTHIYIDTPFLEFPV